MRVAVVGAGVSGLVAAHLLSQAHDVTLFEAAKYAGGHSNTVRVDTEYETFSIDTGFIVFNDRNYPLFQRLLDRLGVEKQLSHMSFGVGDQAGDFEFVSDSINGLFAKRTHVIKPWFYHLVTEVIRFQRAARITARTNDTETTLGDWLLSHGFDERFSVCVAIPMASAVWSANVAEVRSFPARFMFQFLENHGLLDLRNRPRWYTVDGGSQTYVRAIAHQLGDRLHLGTAISTIERHPDRVLVQAERGEVMEFDEVVLATHADQSLAMLSDADRIEQDVLVRLRYQNNDAVLHTDVRLLPRRQRAWASWNYHLMDRAGGPATVTYHMNRLQQIHADRQFCVTLNRTEDIDPATILRRFEYAHPVFTRDSFDAQARHAEISGRRRTHFCGAYWGWGFHEDGVASAVRVAESFGVAGL